tara:strand:- start:663 stop:1589 length:927 start_codon:yes stop_codon:yes gene_type:complete
MLFKKNISWEKKGLFIKNNSNLEWSITHAMIPTPEAVGNGKYKIYFSGRNRQNQSHITWVLVDLNYPYKVLSEAPQPVLYPGRLGCFDDNGVTPSCIIDLSDDLKALYYIGWNPGSTVRMHLFGGLALSNNKGESFERFSEAPIIERCVTDPFLNTAPWVVKVGRNEFRMYYVSGYEWKSKDLPRYNIKTATSSDGQHWTRKGQVCIDFKDDSENALARPYVIYDDNVWKMWFAYKSVNYKLGYAESLDGIIWERRDDFSTIQTGATGDFDSNMVEYASVIKYEEKFFMFYNGNNYGLDGIGLAVEKK